jgi:hypothetical protein
MNTFTPGQNGKNMVKYSRCVAMMLAASNITILGGAVA